LSFWLLDAVGAHPNVINARASEALKKGVPTGKLADKTNEVV
jgi:hypothetical protein